MTLCLGLTWIPLAGRDELFLSIGISQMTPETMSVFFQWAGYLSNPAHRADIHVELRPEKEDEFRREYLELTGEPLLLPGNERPFYIGSPETDKWGIQRRVYFCSDMDVMPEGKLPFGATVREGRTKGQWRINNKKFIPELFKHGFVIGNNADRADVIKKRIPRKFKQDFMLGFNRMSPADRAELLLRRYCERSGMRTQSIAKIDGAWKHSDVNLKNALDILKVRNTIKINSDENAVTYIPQTASLKGEIEHDAIRGMINRETVPERREYLIETYARNRGWKALAQKKFGQYCMIDECHNTFIKSDGHPYIEVHHITPLHEGGEDGVWNLSVLCAHHHRMAHFARPGEKTAIKECLLTKNHDMLATSRRARR